MEHNGAGHKQTGQREAIADPLHGKASRAQRGRSNVRAAEIVDDNADHKVGDRHGTLTDDEGAGIMARLAHLRHDGKEGRRSGVSKNKRG